MVLVGALLLGVYSVRGIIGLVRQTHTRAMEKAFAAAIDKFQKSPPGIERATNFVKELKAIDPGYAPAEVKQALRGYIDAFDQSVAGWKSGHVPTEYDAAIEAARTKLLESVGKFD